MENNASVVIDGVKLLLSSPVTDEHPWIGQSEPMRQLLACWRVIDERDIPLTPRLIGFPGVGKTTLALSAARNIEAEAYIFQCTADTRPEDLIISPVLGENGSISYHASPLLTAIIRGGVAILDEGNRMSEKSWASLAALLDHRRSVDSIIAGIRVKAHPAFRAVVTMNEDSSTFEIPDYIMSRLQPAITIGFATAEEEAQILRYAVPLAHDEALQQCVAFLQKAHGLDLPYSLRDGINIVRYVSKQLDMQPERKIGELLQGAIQQILGDEALDLESLAQKRVASGLQIPGMNLGDLFFGDDDDMNPDRG